MSTTVKVQIQQRIDTAANWASANPTPLSGEICWNSDDKKYKIGDGSTAWASLAYAPGSGGYTAGTGVAISGSNVISASAVALSQVFTAANQTAHLALTTQEGDIVVRSDENKSYVRNSGTSNSMSDFTLLATPTDAVLSVNGNTGAITAAHIAAAVEAASDSNTFTDADHTKLNGIAASANNYSISSDLLDEDDFATNSATKAASQQSIKAYFNANAANTTYAISCVDGDNTDEEKIRLTAGGSGSGTDDIVLEAGTGLSIARSGDKITFTNTISNTDTQLTEEQVEDFVGGMLTGNTETGITVTYQDSDGTIDFVVDSQTDNNFTTTLKNKLDGIASSANNYSISTDLLDEDDFSTNSATKPPSQQSVKAYVDTADALKANLSGATFTGSVYLSSDSNKIYAGAENEMQVFHDGTSSTVKDTRNAGTVKVQADNFSVIDKDASQTMLAITETSATFAGNLNINDNQVIKIGTGEDLQVFHDGTNSYIKNTTNDLTIWDDSRIRVRTPVLMVNNQADTENLLVGTENGSVDLFYDNAKKFETYTGGIKAYNHVRIEGGEGENAVLALYSDEADDAADQWIVVSNASTNAFEIQQWNGSAWEDSIKAIGGGAVTIYHDNSARLATSAAGVTVTGTVTDDKGNLRSIPANSPSSNHVAAATDAGKVIYIAYDVTFNPSVFSAGDVVTVINNSGNNETIVQGTNFTLYNTADASTGNRTLAGRGMATVWFAAHNVGYISGAGLS